MTRAGVFGGMFDPPHNGHVELVRAALAQLALDRVYVVPSGIPPHRTPPVATVPDRLAMARAAFAGEQRVTVSDVETARAGEAAPAYMVDTLAALRAADPGARFTVLAGADQAMAFETWHRWQEILATADLAIANRPDAAGGVQLAAVIRRLDRHRPGAVSTFTMRPHDISSTAIRALLAAGRSTEAAAMVPAGVAALLDTAYGVPSTG